MRCGGGDVAVVDVVVVVVVWLGWQSIAAESIEPDRNRMQRAEEDNLPHPQNTRHHGITMLGAVIKHTRTHTHARMHAAHAHTHGHDVWPEGTLQIT